MKKSRRDYIGISLFGTAIALIVVFIIICLKKRNFPAAIAATAALYATGGLWFMSEHRQSIIGKYCFDEGYRPRRSRVADALAELTHRRDSVSVYEIPVDDEATEEDFAK